jgi:hypothetical protein
MITIVIGALAIPVILTWMLWRMWRSFERSERDPGYRQRRVIGLATLYVASAVFGIVQVAIGKEPKEVLVGLPVVALLAWSLFRIAKRVKVPPP